MVNEPSKPTSESVTVDEIPSRKFTALFRDSESFQMLSDTRAIELARGLNYVGLVVPLLVVLAAIVTQVVTGELPCSHCNLERLAYFTIALGPALNLRFGIRPSHYGISLAGAMFLGTVSIDMMVRIAEQVGPAGYGPVVLGLHVNSWSLIISIIAGIGVVLMLLWERQFDLARPHQTILGRPTGLLLLIALIFVMAVVVLALISAIFECGPGICPDVAPKTYPYWPF
jgi:disulfide bond formation protein DsbB